MPFTNDKILHGKIEALFLNRIKGLEWNYFNLDFNEIFADEGTINSNENYQTFFDLIEVNNLGNYSFPETNDYTYQEVMNFIFTIIRQKPKILLDVMRRLFDTNAIENDSEADEGVMGKFNKKDRAFRNQKFKEKIRRGFRGNKDNVVILAEGDSWFEFPRIFLGIDPVRDIIDWLIEEDNFAISSLAAGGDWLSNILYLGEYIEELPKLSPDVLLISGGGNDLIGDNRLATMVVNPHIEGRQDLTKEGRFKKLLEKREQEENNVSLDLNRYKNGLSLIHDEFFDFINITYVQYFVFLYHLIGAKRFKDMLIITQGYDYAIPYHESRANFLTLQRLVNNFTDTGHWLFEPLCLKGITSRQDQEDVVYTMIYEFNEMLIQLANSKTLPNVFHIDCRGIAEENDWFDELHLKSYKYKEVAQKYKECIKDNLRMKKRDNLLKKVYRVK